MQELIFPKDSNEAKKLSSLLRQHKIRRLYHGIYTYNLDKPIEHIVHEHWLKIVPHIVPQGILSFATAYTLKPVQYAPERWVVFLTSTYTKTINLPGLTVEVINGNNVDYCEQVLPGLARSNPQRMLLENLTVTKNVKYKTVKTIGNDGVENYLAKELRVRHEQELNKIRDAAQAMAPNLGYVAEYKRLNVIIGALLATNIDVNALHTSYAKAIVRQEPYDLSRIKLFETLYIYLKQCNFKIRNYKFSTASCKNIAFFEAYFSNFIEGTEFIINEAEDIIFNGVEINNRHADSHDIVANYRLTSDLVEMGKTPNSAVELLSILQARHAYIMEARPEKQPGKFKVKPNKAGNTYFVAPEDVIGTLTQGFELYKLLDAGLPRALFMQFLISEVHPFVDGNGRLARIMLNAELVMAEEFKIIIPTVHRDNYLNGLRLATRDGFFNTYCKVMDQAQAYTASIDWEDYGAARATIEADQADQIPDEGLPGFNRALRKLELSILG